MKTIMNNPSLSKHLVQLLRCTYSVISTSHAYSATEPVDESTTAYTINKCATSKKVNIHTNIFINIKQRNNSSKTNVPFPCGGSLPLSSSPVTTHSKWVKSASTRQQNRVHRLNWYMLYCNYPKSFKLVTVTKPLKVRHPYLSFPTLYPTC